MSAARAPEKDVRPIARPFFVAWLANASGEYNTAEIGASPIFIGSADPTAQRNPNTGATLAPGSYVGGTAGVGYIVNSSGVPVAVPTQAAQTWTGLQTFGDGAAFLDGDTTTWGTGADVVFTPDGTDVVVTGSGRLLWADSKIIAIGTGADLSLYHDGTDSYSVSATGNWLRNNTAVTGHTYDGLGTNTSATSWAVRNASGTALLEVDGAGTITQQDGTTLLRKGVGTGTGDVIEVVGPDLTHGWKRTVYEATVSPAAIETALFTIPAYSVVEYVQGNIEAALTGGGTTVAASIGITGDVDAYGSFGAPTDTLAKNTKANWGRTAANAGASIGLFSPVSVALKLIAAATGGTAAGNTALTVGSVKVRVVYWTLMSMADAP